MVRFFHSELSLASRRVNITALAVALGFGFLSGSFIAAQSSANGYSMIGIAAGQSVIFSSLLSVAALPFLFTAFAAYIRQGWLLIGIAFAKAFVFSYFSAGVMHLYGASGWLVLVMLLFTDLFALPLLCWVWIRILNHGPKILLRSLSIAFLLLFAIAFLDYRFISPNLVNLLS